MLVDSFDESPDSLKDDKEDINGNLHDGNTGQFKSKGNSNSKEPKKSQKIKNWNIDYAIPDYFDSLDEDRQQDILSSIIKEYFIKNNAIHEGRQGKHIKGHKNYIEGRSVLSVDARKLFLEFAGTSGDIRFDNHGSQIYEIIDTGRIIGEYKNNEDSSMDRLTTRIKIHYSKAGYHIVPARPVELLKY